MGKNTVEPDKLQMTVWRTRIACWILESTNTLRICNIYCFSTATIFSRMHINFILYIHCLSFILCRSLSVVRWSMNEWNAFTVHAVKTCGEIEVHLHPFLTSILSADEFSPAGRLMKNEFKRVLKTRLDVIGLPSRHYLVGLRKTAKNDTWYLDSYWALIAEVGCMLTHT